MKIGLILTKVFTLIFLTACSAVEDGKALEDDKFILSGRIENAGELKSIILYEGNAVVDSIALDKKGEFQLEGSTPEAALYTLLVGQRPYMLILENGEDVEFNADLNNASQYTVSGSEISSKLKELDAIREKFQEQQGTLQSEFEQRMSSGEEMSILQNELMEKNDVYIAELSKQALQFSQENKDNLAGFYGMMILYSVDPTGHEEAFIKYVEEVQDKFPGNHAVQSFAGHMKELKPLSIGQQAPDFSSLTPEGKKVKLSDLRGNTSFWIFGRPGVRLAGLRIQTLLPNIMPLKIKALQYWAYP